MYILKIAKRNGKAEAVPSGMEISYSQPGVESRNCGKFQEVVIDENQVIFSKPFQLDHE